MNNAYPIWICGRYAEAGLGKEGISRQKSQTVGGWVHLTFWGLRDLDTDFTDSHGEERALSVFLCEIRVLWSARVNPKHRRASTVHKLRCASRAVLPGSASILAGERATGSNDAVTPQGHGSPEAPHQKRERRRGAGASGLVGSRFGYGGTRRRLHSLFRENPGNPCPDSPTAKEQRGHVPAVHSGAVPRQLAFPPLQSYSW